MSQPPPPTPPALDHTILLLPCSPQSGTPLIPASISKNFTLTPGGTHADGLTANTLILLQDGSYIELICFLNSEQERKEGINEGEGKEGKEGGNEAIEKHWWGGKGDSRRKIGWVDWCLAGLGPSSSNSSTSTTTTTTIQPSQTSPTSSPPSPSPASNHPGPASHLYAPPLPGGRILAPPSNAHISWLVTFPLGTNNGQALRGLVPFFCQDVTPRDLRVPLTAERTTHACGAVGVREITVVVREEREMGRMGEVYASIFGAADEGEEETTFEVSRIHGGDLPPVCIRLRGVRSDTREAERLGASDYAVIDIVLCVPVKAEEEEERRRGERVRLDAGEGAQDLGGVWLEYV